jgi:FOG: TPR repeat, SEL1 subfamily
MDIKDSLQMRNLIKAPYLLALTLGAMASISSAEASKRVGESITRENEEVKRGRVDDSVIAALEAEDTSAQDSSVTWEELFYKMIHAPQEIKRDPKLQDTILDYSSQGFFIGQERLAAALIPDLIPDLKIRAQSDARALLFLIEAEDVLTEDTLREDNLTEDTALMINALKEKRDIDSLMVLGICYNDGLGVEQDLTRSFAIYQPLAEQGYAQAQFSLGNCYLYGMGVDKDVQNAMHWFQKAADQGYAPAQNELGHCYLEALEGDVSENLLQAAHWFCKAAEQGFAKAQSNLGGFYYNGKGAQRDLEKAVYWYHRAAKQKDVNALYTLGFIYFCGEGVEKDTTRAKFWLQEATKQGHSQAPIYLGNIYYTGSAGQQDLKAAFWFYLLAGEGLAEEGSEAAKNFADIKERFQVVFHSNTERSDPEYIYTIENSPLAFYEVLSARLADINRSFYGTLEGDKDVAHPAMLPLRKPENIAKLYDAMEEIRHTLEETLPRVLSKAGFLITNVTFEHGPYKVMRHPYIKHFPIKGKNYLCLGDDNINIINNMFALFSQTEKRIKKTQGDIECGIKTLQNLSRLKADRDEQAHDQAASDLIGSYRNILETLEEAKSFTVASWDFVEDSLCATASYRNEAFKDEFGFCFE